MGNIQKYLTRAINLAVLTTLLSLIAVLSVLVPSPEGLGTHQQLLPLPCLFHRVFGIPCPSCGLTTSLSYLLHGDIAASFKAHPLGPLFGLAFLIMIFQSVRGVIQDRAWWMVTEKRWFQNGILCGIGVYLGTWIIRLII